MAIIRPKRILTHLATDILTLLLCSVIIFYVFKEVKISKLEWKALLAFLLLWFVIENWLIISNERLNPRFRKSVSSHFKAYAVFIGMTILLSLFFPIRSSGRVRIIGLVVGIAMLDMFISHLLISISGWFKVTLHAGKQIVIAGIGASARKAASQLSLRNRDGYELKGFIHCSQQEEGVIDGNRVLGDLEDMNEYLETNLVDEIVIALPGHFTKEIRNVLSVADYHGIRTKYILDYKEMFGSQYVITKFGRINAVSVRHLPIDGRIASIFKSAFDRVFAATILVTMLPLFLIIGLMIKIESRGPVFYCPVRIGRGGKPFRVFKFRSMRANDDSNKGVLSTVQNDPRITRLGAFLRKYSLDELPQFFNVLIGNMSVVGPRPHRRFLDRELQQSVSGYMIRHYVNPGITGWAQVNGWRGPSVTPQQKKMRTEHDLFYVENWSFWFDIRIIFYTVFSKKTHTGAF
ncbi:MAG: exopolysaccharide biosynthesis polyprenyl glycosylphosphotransferase [Chitinophagaceae bacterium]